jgi:N-glycosylase/DNA lyase
MITEWIQNDKNLTLYQADDFDLAATFQCGQCFRWKEVSPGRFGIIAYGKYCEAEAHPDDNTITFYGVSPEDWTQIWAPYFDLDTDYGAIRQRLCALEPVLEEAASFAPGIRILRQEPWEALCSFIISQNNHIPRIQGIIDRLCQQFGTKIGEGQYAFPTPEQMADLTEEDLSPLRCGFRAKYLCSAARLVHDGTVPLSDLYTMPLDDARRCLQQIHGVGPKVAECVLLYGYHRMECFPMDVWMKRAMAVLLPGKDGTYFGKDAGVAQQYLFHFSRMHPERFSKET